MKIPAKLAVALRLFGSAAAFTLVAWVATQLPLPLEKQKGVYGLVMLALYGLGVYRMVNDDLHMSTLFGSLIGGWIGIAIVMFPSQTHIFLGLLAKNLRFRHVWIPLVAIATQLTLILTLKFVAWPIVRAVRGSQRRAWQETEYDTDYVWKDRSGRTYGRVSRTDLERLGLRSPASTPLDAGKMARLLAVIVATVAAGKLLVDGLPLESSLAIGSAWVVSLAVALVIAHLGRARLYYW